MQLSSISLAITRQYGPLRAFNPATLFANGEQGLIYDPSDLTTLFQDSAGTTPVTALEQPVGLMLDKRLGLVLGSEKVINGDFSQGSTGWSLGAGWTISAGVASLNGGSGLLTDAANYSSYVTGRWYKVTFDVSSKTSGGTFQVYLRGAVGVLSGITAVGTYTFYAIAGSATTEGVSIIGLSSCIGSIDNISVRELPGNHAFQPTSASRPVLSARYNLLTKTEDFSDAVWTKVGTTPVGATKITETATTGEHVVNQNVASISGVTYQALIVAKQAERSILRVGFANLANANVYFDLASGTKLTQQSSVISAAISPVGDGSYTITAQWAANGTSNFLTFGPAPSDNTATFTGIAGNGVYAYKADLRPTNDGIGLPPYQRVNTATDYDSVGFSPYLKTDGVDDFMLTNSIDFTGTDKITAWVGVRKLSDAARGVVAELGNSNDGIISLFAPSAALLDYQFVSRGTVSSAATASGYAAPITNVLTGIGNISGDQSILRANGAQVAINSADQGTGNYGNYPLYLFRRAGTSLPATVRFFGAVIRGAQSTAAQIAATEAYLNSKTKAF